MNTTQQPFAEGSQEAANRKAIKLVKRGGTFIVSANYRDRKSAYKWLIRRIDQPLSLAIAYKKVAAKGVRFESSGKEEGFGCSVVACCDAAIGEDREPVEIMLRFNGSSFVNRETNNIVTSVAELILYETGDMRAMVS